MALRGQFLIFCVLVLLVFESRSAYGSSRGWLGRAGDATAAQEIGICASSVIIHGYKCQEIDVTTKDGYILNLQRIPEGRAAGGGQIKRPPVLIQHGVLVDGLTWLLNPPEQNLPLILADHGFDEFWNWSWDELVAYDLPAVFDHVYEQTGQKIHYVGHSLGTLIALASFSEGLQVDKLKSAALLSPIAYLSYMRTALGVIAAKSFVGEITTLLGLAEFNPKGKPVADFLKSLCTNPVVNCYDLLTSLTAVRDGVIAKFNYGRPDYNLMHYGEFRPPIYNISNIPHDLPLFVSYGGNDALADVRDVENLLDSFKFHDGDKLGVQFIKSYGHADFIMGINAKDIVYNQVVAFFKRQN
ncbi:triacylglycerol lipase 2 [Citrus sinensis]|uniref:Triacylglycerol lipase 2 n=1 Tax=Citrus sinensis TaxID=2711 RepID=A0ACB8N2B1_CITSI|nr:triacylglycerol lipase 2 [Citrus sinensis]